MLQGRSAPRWFRSTSRRVCLHIAVGSGDLLCNGFWAYFPTGRRIYFHWLGGLAAPRWAVLFHAQSDGSHGGHVRLEGTEQRQGRKVICRLLFGLSGGICGPIRGRSECYSAVGRSRVSRPRPERPHSRMGMTTATVPSSLVGQTFAGERSLFRPSRTSFACMAESASSMYRALKPIDIGSPS